MGNGLAATAYAANILPFGFLGFASGLIVMLFARNDKIARFHGAQAMLLGVTAMITGFALAFVTIILESLIFPFILLPAMFTVFAGGGSFWMMLSGMLLSWLLMLLPFIPMLLFLLLNFAISAWLAVEASRSRTPRLPVLGRAAELCVGC